MGFAFKMDLAGTMQNVLGVLSKQLVSVDSGFGKVTASVGSFEKSFLAVEGVKALGRAAMWAVREVTDLGGAILRINAQAQDLNLAANLQLGPEGAAMLSRLADSFANTRFDGDAIMQALLPLANAGIKDEETLDAIATAATDISTRFNTGQAGFESATEALGKIALKREAGARQLEALGINEADFLATVSKATGQSVEAVKKAMQAGKIAAPTLLNAALATVAAKQGGALGVAALAGGKTLGATLQRLSDLPSNLFKQLADSPGLKKVQDAIEGIMSSLSGERGAALVARLGDGLVRVFEVATPERIIGAFETLIDLVDGTITVVGYAIDFVRDFGTGLGILAAELYLTGEAIINGIGKGIDWLLSLPGKAVDIGKAIVDGLISGITSGLSAVGNTVTSLGQSAIDSLKSALGIASPSRVFAELGGYTAEGFALGMERGTGDVLDASRALSAAALPTALPVGAAGLAAQAAGVTPGGGLSLSVGEVHVYTSATDAHGTGEAVRREIVEAFRQIATEVGVPV